MRIKFIVFLMMSWIVFFFPAMVSSKSIQEGGVTINVNRVLTGATTGTHYYGYSSGSISLPHNKGGMLTFTLWNDMQVNGTAHTNFFNTSLGGRAIKIPSYSTKNQLLEEYKEFRGQWGPAGINRITLAIPPGISTLKFHNGGSATGIELSHLRFIAGYTYLPKGYKKEPVRTPGKPIIQVARILKGSKSGELFYGFQRGTIFLPHGYGGYLTFRVYNDQQLGCSSFLNKINITAGHLKESFTQYTSSLDLVEDYQEFKNQWGPAGGSRVIIQVPEEVTQVNFNNSGSQSGIEISQLSFTKGAPLVFSFEERVNRQGAVCKIFGRTLHHAVSGQEFNGFASGRVLLPNNKGGILSFNFWNDHSVGTAQIHNQLNITAGTVKMTVKQTTTNDQRNGFYKEYMNQWGPAGGKIVNVKIPPGVSRVDFNHAGSQSGFELNNFVFRSN
ncbi:hypothetical protein SAMN02746065_12073 [Desulfocicer vacuolatum DSM 3385]|uniref:Uncharacterized protein n=1 Tax=Desulfocicer vacuolatum DSM 3385 TaxID=1121400 RepID=A0A1W2DU61_9BACT|nr:hypothetical protein [Desulfocicer vacuolatum]SMD00999.1 hypothetical protein SAMN02746065_12073 [Desulfocicer vacuolatum DSM 3385]